MKSDSENNELKRYVGRVTAFCICFFVVMLLKTLASLFILWCCGGFISF